MRVVIIYYVLYILPVSCATDICARQNSENRNYDIVMLTFIILNYKFYRITKTNRAGYSSVKAYGMHSRSTNPIFKISLDIKRKWIQCCPNFITQRLITISVSFVSSIDT